MDVAIPTRGQLTFIGTASQLNLFLCNFETTRPTARKKKPRTPLFFFRRDFTTGRARVHMWRAAERGGVKMNTQDQMTVREYTRAGAFCLTESRTRIMRLRRRTAHSASVLRLHDFDVMMHSPHTRACMRAQNMMVCCSCEHTQTSVCVSAGCALVDAQAGPGVRAGGAEQPQGRLRLCVVGRISRANLHVMHPEGVFGGGGGQFTLVHLARLLCCCGACVWVT